MVSFFVGKVKNGLWGMGACFLFKQVWFLELCIWILGRQGVRRISGFVYSRFGFFGKVQGVGIVFYFFSSIKFRGFFRELIGFRFLIVGIVQQQLFSFYFQRVDFFYLEFSLENWGSYRYGRVRKYVKCGFSVQVGGGSS